MQVFNLFFSPVAKEPRPSVNSERAEKEGVGDQQENRPT
jgi:hypothetical protein